MKRAGRITSVLLSILLICACMPTLSFADDEVPATPLGEDVLNANSSTDTTAVEPFVDDETPTTPLGGDALGTNVSTEGLAVELRADEVASTEDIYTATDSTATLVTTNSTPEDSSVEPLANDDYIDVDLSKIDEIDYVNFLKIELRVLTSDPNILGLFVTNAGGTSTDTDRLEIGGKPVKSVTIPDSSEPVKTYRFIGDWADNGNYPDGMQLTINGRMVSTTIAIECGDETTGLTLNSSIGNDTTKEESALNLCNSAQVQMTLNNNVSLTSQDGYAGINVPAMSSGSDCQLDIYGPAVATTPPTLTAVAGVGAAGIGGNAGYSQDGTLTGQPSGNIYLYNNLNIVATGGDADVNHSGGAGIGGGGAYLNHLDPDVVFTGGDAGFLAATGNVIIEATGGGDGAGIGGGGGGSKSGENGGNAEEFVTAADANGVWPTIRASSTGRGAGIGGGGGYMGGHGFIDFVNSSHLNASSYYGAGIGGGAGTIKGGDCGGFRALGGSVLALCLDGYSSGIGGGAGGAATDGTYTPGNQGGKGNYIAFGEGSTAPLVPLFATVNSSYGSDIGPAPDAETGGTEPDAVVIAGGSIVADSFSVYPTDGTKRVYPVLIPKESDVTPTTPLTGHLNFEVPVLDAQTYYVTSVDSDNPEHDNIFLYAAQLWLPEGFIGGITGATADVSVSIEGGHVDVLAKDAPDFVNGENVVSFAPYTLTLNYAQPSSSLTPVDVEVAGGSIYTLPSEQKIYATWQLTGWSDGTSQYQLGANYTMPSKDTTLTGIWEQRPLTEVLLQDKTDDLGSIKGDKDIRVGLDVVLSELKEVGYANANGTNYKALTKDKEYGLISGSTIVVLKASWLATLKPGNYLLRVTYTDHYYDIPFTKVAAAPQVIPRTADGASIAAVGGAVFLTLGSLCIAGALRLRRRRQGQS